MTIVHPPAYHFLHILPLCQAMINLDVCWLPPRTHVRCTFLLPRSEWLVRVFRLARNPRALTNLPQLLPNRTLFRQTSGNVIQGFRDYTPETPLLIDNFRLQDRDFFFVTICYSRTLLKEFKPKLIAKGRFVLSSLGPIYSYLQLKGMSTIQSRPDSNRSSSERDSLKGACHSSQFVTCVDPRMSKLESFLFG